MATEVPPLSPPPGRILVRGVNWLGDAVMTTPAMQRLRERHPQAHISLLTPAKLAGLWEEHPSVDQVIAIPPGEGLLATGRRLRDAGFDLGLVFPNSPRTALELWLGRVPARMGFAARWRRVFLTRALPARRNVQQMRKRREPEIREALRTGVSPGVPLQVGAHQMHHYLHLVAEATGASPEPLPPRLPVAAAALESFRSRFPGTRTAQPILGLNAGAEYGPAKRWPLERYIETASRILDSTPATWVLFGGPADRDNNARIRSALAERHPEWSDRVVDVAGQTSLAELKAGLSLCRAVVTNDTGPMHVAAAVGTRVIVPVGSTSMELTGPGEPGNPGGRHVFLGAGAPCSPCFLRECPVDFRCMLGIPVESVVAAVHQVLAS